MNAAILRYTVIVLGVLSLIGSGAHAKKLAFVKEIDGEPVHRVLGKDAIPSIDKPKFVAAEKARFLRDVDPVIGVVRHGVAKAYSVFQLDGHEIVNDSFGSDPVMVTW